VFLLLLSNDKPVLGPWANTARVNIFTGAVIAVLVALSVVLTASTLFAGFGTMQILWTLGIGLTGALGIGLWLAVAQKRSWRMPPLAELPPAKLSALNRVWLLILRAYLVCAVMLVIYKVALLALHGA
jgi:hypothetical protein